MDSHNVEDVEMGEECEHNSDVESNDNSAEEKSVTYLPGQPLKENEELVCDQSAYIMYHEANAGTLV